MEHKDDLTSGSIGKKVISFAAPIILANLIQAIYGLVDMVTVGHFVGASGMSAVSAVVSAAPSVVTSPPDAVVSALPAASEPQDATVPPRITSAIKIEISCIFFMIISSIIRFVELFP